MVYLMGTTFFTVHKNVFEYLRISLNFKLLTTPSQLIQEATTIVRNSLSLFEFNKRGRRKDNQNLAEPGLAIFKKKVHITEQYKFTTICLIV